MLRHDSHPHHHGHPLSALNGVMFLRALAVSLTGIFVPALLFKLGHSFTQVILFYIVYQAFVIPLQWVTLNSIAKFGIEKTIMLSAIPAAMSFFTLMIMQEQIWWIILLSLTSAIADIFFWIPYHFDYMFATKKGQTGRSSGLLLAMQIMGSTIGPVLGGIALTLWSKNVLLLIAVMLALSYSIPLFLNKNDRKLRVTYGAKLDRNNFAFYCEGLTRASFSIIWPIFLIITGVTVFALGILYSGARVCVAVCSAILGKYSDLHQHKSQKIFEGSTLATSATYTSRLFFLAPLSIALITVFGEVFFTFMNVPFTKRWLDIAKQSGVQFLVQREIMVCTGRITLLFIVAVIGLTNVGLACTVGLLIGAISTLGFLLIEKPKNIIETIHIDKESTR